MYKRSAQLAAILRELPRNFSRRAPRDPSAPLRLRFVYYNIGVSTRYRIQNQIEQAELAGFEGQDAPMERGRDLYNLTSCDLLYLCRTPLAPRLRLLCATARHLHIPIVFDCDDLVWDPEEWRYNYLDQHYDPRLAALIMKANRQTRALMRWANAFVFSTPYLAQLAFRSFNKPTYVNPNALSRAMLANAAAVYAHRRDVDAERVVIGYFCGTPRVHDEDVASIAPALRAVLSRHPQVVLHIYGEVRLPEALAGPVYASRIEKRPAVDWRELPKHIAQVAINIAPLIDNPQRRGKSSIKYLEAALVGVPTVATRLDPYQYDIADDRTGLLASTTEEWIDCLTRLILSPELRQRLGTAAREDALANHTTAVRAANFASIIERVVGDR